MYIEFNNAPTKHTTNTLALDWDETTSDYPLSFLELTRRFDRVIIITLNQSLILAEICQFLERDPAEVEIYCCPYEKTGEVADWKAQICFDEKVALMFDDDPRVIRACHNLGVNAICVREREWKFEQTKD